MGVGGWFRSNLLLTMNRPDLNNPPTPVGGIQRDVGADGVCRLDLNESTHFRGWYFKLIHYLYLTPLSNR
jgi:hypothetical protein